MIGDWLTALLFIRALFWLWSRSAPIILAFVKIAFSWRVISAKRLQELEGKKAALSVYSQSGKESLRCNQSIEISFAEYEKLKHAAAVLDIMILLKTENPYQARPDSYVENKKG